jgi:hypothetical protein
MLCTSWGAAIETGIFPLYESRTAWCDTTAGDKSIVEGRAQAGREYLSSRAASRTSPRTRYFQTKVDGVDNRNPGVVPFGRLDATKRPSTKK